MFWRDNLNRLLSVSSAPSAASALSFGCAGSLGTASANATVTLWSSDGSSASSQRKGNYYRAELPVANTSAAHWLALTNLAVLNNGTNADIVATTVGHEFLPQTPEHYTYDADGNLTQDGHWNYTWDAENRLVKLAPSTALGPQFSLAFEYDWQGRRIHKQVWPNTIWSGTPTNDVKFVYDGWNLVAVLNSSFSLQSSFVWGSDLSGSIQGAGGVGGLLFICDLPSAIGYSAPAFDGNGNVMALASMSGGTNCAAYEYGPFGEVVRATGTMAKTNPFRFSTKYQDDETDLFYYGYRYYNPSTGRWLNRDHIREVGGVNIYSFVRNNAIGFFDLNGQITVRTITDKPNTSCGSMDVYWNFILDEPAAEDGYIIQEMSIDFNYNNCGIVNSHDGDHYWEAWLVKAGHRFSTFQWVGSTDHALWDPHPGTQSAGPGKQVGKIKFFFKSRTGDLGDPGATPIIPPDPSSGWTWRLQSPWSWDLPSTRAKPSYWDQPSDNGESDGARSVEVTWSCCCNNNMSLIVVTP